jgi:hypothetical protein
MRTLIVAIIFAFMAVLPASAQMTDGPMPMAECIKNFPNLGRSGCRKVHQLHRTPEQTAKRIGKPLLYNGYYYGPPSGGSPHAAMYVVYRMNKQNNTLVVGRHCNSACAIMWNLAKKKCLLFGGQVGLAQHKRVGNTPVNHRSRSWKYWRKAALNKRESSHEMVYWNGSAPKCPSGITIAGYDSAKRQQHRDRAAPYSRRGTPDIFQPRY